METMTRLREMLAAALEERQAATATTSPEAGDVTALHGGRGLHAAHDRHPAVSMAPRSSAGAAMEAARLEGLRAGRADRSARRMAAARARAARKAQLDAVAASPVVPDPQRLEQAWNVLTPLIPIVERIAAGKAAWARRFLGSASEDIASMAIEAMVLVLARSTTLDLDVLATAATQLAQAGGVPGDQPTGDDRAAKGVGRSRKWLMGLVNNRVMGALVDAYTASNGLRWQNIDLVATVMTSISGVGEDPMVAHTKASRAPAMVADHTVAPGAIDSGLLAAAINAAITDRRLDRMTEVLLANLRTDGSVAWAQCAQAVFEADPRGSAWPLVCQATAHLADPRAARADAARTLARLRFDWLPGLVVALVDAFEVHLCAYEDGTTRLGNDFDSYLCPSVRHPLRPALVFTDAGQAAAALAAHLSALVSGTELVASLAYA